MWIASGMASNVNNAIWWNEMYKCNGNGDLVNQYAVKIEHDSGDDTGLSYIWMQCESGKNIKGGFVSWGTYGSTRKCPNYMVGFQLQICNSNVSATNMVMYCSRDSNDYKSSGTWDGSDGPCNWGPVQYCPENYGICGFQYEYEPFQDGEADESAISNVKMWCCLVPVRLSTQTTINSMTSLPQGTIFHIGSLYSLCRRVICKTHKHVFILS